MTKTIGVAAEIELGNVFLRFGIGKWIRVWAVWFVR